MRILIIKNFKIIAINTDLIMHLNVWMMIDDIPTKCHHIFALETGNVNAKVPFKIIHGSFTTDMISAVSFFMNIIARNIVNFIINCSENFFINIFIGNNTASTTIFINNNGNRRLFLEHFLQNVLQRYSFRNGNDIPQ